MPNAGWARSTFLLLLGVLCGGLLTAAWEHHNAQAQQNQSRASLAALQEDVAHLKQLIPPHSHPMVDVGMFAANLWFAADKKNWPLAGYYLNEMRNRIQWEVRVNPDPKGTDGKPVEMQSIFDSINNDSLANLKKDVQMKDSKQFATDYKHLLEECYSCHQTAGRPYIRPMVPIAGPQPIVNLDSSATWPQ